jgi:GNAT superfamily N-acetyltransferase
VIQTGTSDTQTTRRHDSVLKIRTLGATDSLVELTGLIHRAYARLGEMGLQHTAVDQSAEVTAQRIRGGSCYVATLADAIVGTITVHPTYAQNACAHFTRRGVAVAHQLAVEPLHQGLGIGRRLLQTAEQWATQRGFRELALDTAERAMHLVQLYTRLGYRPVGYVTWPGKNFRCVVLSKHLQ